jgi:hypothetical protein
VSSNNHNRCADQHRRAPEQRRFDGEIADCCQSL